MKVLGISVVCMCLCFMDLCVYIKNMNLLRLIYLRYLTGKLSFPLLIIYRITISNCNDKASKEKDYISDKTVYLFRTGKLKEQKWKF